MRNADARPGSSVASWLAALFRPHGRADSGRRHEPVSPRVIKQIASSAAENMMNEGRSENRMFRHYCSLKPKASLFSPDNGKVLTREK